MALPLAPVDTLGVDSPVSEVGQWVATVLTFSLAAVVLVWLVMLCRRERVIWPLLVAVGGTLTCLMEPLFDHLYGLWFFEQDQWSLYTTFGSHQPVWVPGAYLVFYGGATVLIARVLGRWPTMRTVWTLYGCVVAMAITAEMTYVSVLGVYAYQDSQPFVLFGYPVFLGFTNAMAALVGGIVVYRLVPVLTRLARLSLIMVVPLAFAMDLFGAGILYLSIRHGLDDPPTVLTHLGALTVVGGIAATVRLLGALLVEGSEDVGRPRHNTTAPDQIRAAEASSTELAAEQTTARTH